MKPVRSSEAAHHAVSKADSSMRAKERGLHAVVLLAAVMTVAEIAVGHWAGSMALLADGWHMATHVGALGLSALAYALARRFATHRAFTFGTGKVHALAGYTSAVTLGLVALGMAVESATRLLHPRPVNFAQSIPVAVLGLVVNLISARLLHDGEGRDCHAPGAQNDDHHHDEHDHHHDEHDHHHDEHDHHHGEHDHDEPDHNHQAALTHVLADALTSTLAIVALLAGRFLSIAWLDPVAGMLSAGVILKWSVDLCRGAAFELLDVTPSPVLEQKIRQLLEGLEDVRISDLRVWSLGRGKRSAVLTLVSSAPKEVHYYRAKLAPLKLAHLTIEVQQS